MQIGHQFGQIAVGGDQLVIHVARMGRRVADTLDALDFGQHVAQGAKADAGAVGIKPVIGVDVLAQKGDFAHTGISQPAGFG